MLNVNKCLLMFNAILLALLGIAVIAHYYVLPYYHEKKVKHDMAKFFQMDEVASSSQGNHP